MSIIDQMAARVAKRMMGSNSAVCGGPVGFIDPLTLLTIAGLIISFIQMLQGCGASHEDALYRMKNPGILDNWAKRRLIRKRAKAMPKVYGGEGRTSLVDIRSDLEAGLNDEIDAATISDMPELYAAASAAPRGDMAAELKIND
jgi:hypothetical protein